MSDPEAIARLRSGIACIALFNGPITQKGTDIRTALETHLRHEPKKVSRRSE